MSVIIDKDTLEVLDYTFNWGNWLPAGDTIVSFEIISSDVTLDDDSNTGTTVTIWLSGGVSGEKPRVRCKITTAAGRTAIRTIRININDR
jgi:hypothetical protein